MPDPIDRLYRAVSAVRQGQSSQSRTARLLQGGRMRMAKKLVEEATEVTLDAVAGDREAVIRESADLVYHLTVLWVELGISPDDVWAEMVRREKLYGIAEKLHKGPVAVINGGVAIASSEAGKDRKG